MPHGLGLLATHRRREMKTEDDFAAMGLTGSQAVRLLVHRSENRRGPVLIATPSSDRLVRTSDHDHRLYHANLDNG